MNKIQIIQKKVRELLESQRLGVLATHRKGQPYTSLVAFFATADLKHLFFATPNTTRKYENLKQDPRVAMMVNSSMNRESDFHRAIAVTVTGQAEEVSGKGKQKGQEMYLKKHPHLEDFVRSPTCALIKLTARSFYTVQHFQDVMEFQLD